MNTTALFTIVDGNPTVAAQAAANRAHVSARSIAQKAAFLLELGTLADEARYWLEGDHAAPVYTRYLLQLGKTWRAAMVAQQHAETAMMETTAAAAAALEQARTLNYDPATMAAATAALDDARAASLSMINIVERAATIARLNTEARAKHPTLAR